MKPVFRFISSCISENNSYMRHKTPLLLIKGLSREHHARLYNVSKAHISHWRRIDYHSLRHSRTFDTSPRTIFILYLSLRDVGVQQKYSSTARTRARGSYELKNRTVINNRFLPAPVCAAPGQGKIFFRRGLYEAGRGGDEVDGGENVGHKNVPVRNGPGEEKTRRVYLFAGDRTFGMVSRSHAS